MNNQTHKGLVPSGLNIAVSDSDQQIYVSTQSFLKLAYLSAKRAKKLPRNVELLMAQIFDQLELDELRQAIEKTESHYLCEKLFSYPGVEFKPA